MLYFFIFFRRLYSGYPNIYYRAFILLCELSEVLDCTNHLRSIGVLVVIPGNNLNLIQSVAEIGNHGLCGIEE